MEDERLTLLLGALGYAPDFQTWRSIVRQQGLNEERAVDVMVCMARCAMRN